eukprot:gnl/TRDRNA2_/TRDRNA2_93921_c0_seq1.p1 gnl/TRDRNA2_/TRDRNA2_93921_c0~~gnl/TRDRNA2_/TRDRNA2_93921_c0_seq1.p1  ORF type:complete len:318 (+),score=12.40 gnl/TRDRNA2_/TRDRNA2_93921_c0_seq1:23-976(+)
MRCNVSIVVCALGCALCYALLGLAYVVCLPDFQALWIPEIAEVPNIARRPIVSEEQPSAVQHVVECWTECLSLLPQPWIVLAGDSNMRHTYTRLLERLNQSKRVRLTSKAKKADSSASIEQGLNESRWFDDDAIFTTSSQRMIRVSLRFIWNSTVILDHWHAVGSNPWTEIRQCRMSDQRCWMSPQPHVFSLESWQERPPHALIFSHGLWGYFHLVPLDGCFRQESIGRLLQSWSTEIPFLRWVSNFPINKHPFIRRVHLTHDYSCQHNVSEALGLSLIDTWRLVGDEVVNVTDCHYKTTVQDEIIRYIFQGVCATC